MDENLSEGNLMLWKSQDRHPGTRNVAPINTAGFIITLPGAEGLGGSREHDPQLNSPCFGNAQEMNAV